MDKRTYLTILYDYYSELFNDHQRTIFEDYYFHNLSLSEISENHNITRSAIHKTIKAITDKLEEYEHILKLYKKGIIIDKIINQIDDEKLKKKLEELK